MENQLRTLHYAPAAPEVIGALHSRRIKAGVAVALVLGICVLFFLGVREQSPTRNAPAEKLRIALSMNPHSALLQIALAKGYFADEGLDLTITPTTHGKVGIELLLQGKADLATASEVPFVRQVLAGQPLSIAAAVLTVSSDAMVVARRDHGIGSPRDLMGKRVGVTFGSSGEYFLWTFLIRQRLPPDSLTLVDVLPEHTVQMLVDGTIDATATWNVIASGAQLALGENAQSFTEANAYSETHVVVGRTDFVTSHPKVVEKLMRALLRAEQFNRSDPESGLCLVAEQLKINVEALRPNWNSFNFRVNLLQSQLITLEDEARWAMERGYAPRGPVHNFLPNLYLDALLAVQPERVTVVH